MSRRGEVGFGGQGTAWRITAGSGQAVKVGSGEARSVVVRQGGRGYVR